MASTRFFQTCFGVFQGGGCRGAAFVGAYEEAAARGVSFSGVAGASAGSIVATLIGAGASSGQLKDILLSLDFKSLIAAPDRVASSLMRFALKPFNLTRFGPIATAWSERGLHSSSEIEAWMNRTLTDVIPGKGRNIRFVELPIPTWVVATDIVSRDVKIWSSWTTPEDEVAQAVRCSCSIPGFFQPVHTRFVDGGVLSNLPAFVFQHAHKTGHAPLSTRILAFTLTASAESSPPKNTQQAALALIDTIIDGGANIQQRIADVHVIDIATGSIRATDFHLINSEALETLIENGRHAARTFFDDELARIRASEMPSGLLTGDDEVYAGVTERLNDSGVRHVWVVGPKTRWLYAIYPSILYWLISGVEVTVVLQKGSFDDHEEFRRRLLRAMGVRSVRSRENSNSRVHI